MPEGDIYLLKWKFTPADFFEQPVAFVTPQARIDVGLGEAEMRAPISAFPGMSNAEVCNLMHAELDARFIGGQVQSHLPFVLDRPSFSILHADGTSTAIAFAAGATIRVSVGRVDFVTTDASGNVVQDSRKERIQAKQSFAELAARHFDDPTANAILRSYAAAIADPANELIHLYEVRDALFKTFPSPPGTKAKDRILTVAQAVGVGIDKLNRLHELACDLPLAQGRHRGTHRGALRAATDEELDEARSSARAMIEGYLRQLM
jgi:hypothetical protein